MSTELELADEDDKVPCVVSSRINSICSVLTTNRYKIGDTFFNLPVPEVQELLSTSVERIDGEVSNVEDKLTELREEMQELKAALYGRFGKSINLEA